MKYRFLYVGVVITMGILLLAHFPAMAQNPYFPKPNLVVIHIKAPLEAHPGDDIGGQVELTIYNSGIAPAEGGYRIDFFISTDRKVEEIVQGPSETFVEDVLLEGGRTGGLPELAVEQTFGFTQARLVLMQDIPLGSYQICAFVDPDDVVEEEDIGSNFLCAPIHIVATGQSDLPEENPRSSLSGSHLSDYDLDGNCLLGDSEFFAVVDDWTTSNISESLFFSAIDMWMSQSSLCEAVVASSKFEIEQTESGILFSVSDQQSLDVVVYDMGAREVFSQPSASNKLHWNLKNSLGERVPNGVYFVKVGHNEFRKIVVMR